MKLLLNISNLILVTLTCIFACRTAPLQPASPEPKQNADWRLFTPPDKSFSVELPCDPVQRNVSTPSNPVYEYGCSKEETSALTFFTVSVVNMSPQETARMRNEAAFERSVKDSFSPNRRLVKMTSLKIENGVGREVFVTNTRDEMDNLRGRTIIFGGRRYDVSFVATDGKALESAPAKRFFATFKPLR